MPTRNHLHYNHLLTDDEVERPEGTLADYITRNSPHALDWHPVENMEPAYGPLTAVDLLENGASILSDRGKQRDSEEGERSMARAVRAFWAVYGECILQRGYMLESEGWEFMCFLKKSRKTHGVYNRDDYEDDVNYAALAGEAAEKEEWGY